MLTLLSLGPQFLRYLRVMRLWPDHAWPWWFRNHWQWLWHLRGFNMYIHITLLCIANVCTNHKTWQISGVWLVLSSRHIQRSVCKLQGNQERRTGSQMRQLPAGKNGLESVRMLWDFWSGISIISTALLSTYTFHHQRVSQPPEDRHCLPDKCLSCCSDRGHTVSCH